MAICRQLGASGIERPWECESIVGHQRAGDSSYIDCVTGRPAPIPSFCPQHPAVHFERLQNSSSADPLRTNAASLAHNVELNRQLVEETWHRVERGGRTRALSRTSAEPGDHRAGYKRHRPARMMRAAQQRQRRYSRVDDDPGHMEREAQRARHYAYADRRPGSPQSPTYSDSEPESPQSPTYSDSDGEHRP